MIPRSGHRIPEAAVTPPDSPANLARRYFLDLAAAYVRGMLPEYMERIGFRGVAETHRERTVFGTLALYRAVKPG